jgi:hypothetical protein
VPRRRSQAALREITIYSISAGGAHRVSGEFVGYQRKGFRIRKLFRVSGAAYCSGMAQTILQIRFLRLGTFTDIHDRQATFGERDLAAIGAASAPQQLHDRAIPL